MDYFNPQNILLCLLSKQTGAPSSMHGMQCNWANSLCKDLSSSEQCEFKWYELKPSILDEGLRSEGIWMEPRTCWSLWGLGALYAVSEMTVSVRVSFSVWNTHGFFINSRVTFLLKLRAPSCSHRKKLFLFRHLQRFCKMGRHGNQNLLKVKEKMTGS